jgi:DNA polymerase-3 subunit alpha
MWDGKNIITQYDMWSCEEAGLVKMDFLGIRNLSIMGSAVIIIKKTKDIDIDLGTIPLNDKNLCSYGQGETMGMFQLGGSGITRYLRELKPTTITDVMAMVAYSGQAHGIHS